MFTAEHGPGYDDEVTPLRAGGNAGWDPKVCVAMSSTFLFLFVLRVCCAVHLLMMLAVCISVQLYPRCVTLQAFVAPMLLTVHAFVGCMQISRPKPTSSVDCCVAVCNQSLLNVDLPLLCRTAPL